MLNCKILATCMIKTSCIDHSVISANIERDSPVLVEFTYYIFVLRYSGLCNFEYKKTL